MNKVIKISDWNLGNKVQYVYVEDKIRIINSSNEKVSVRLKKTIEINDKNILQFLIDFKGEYENSGGYIEINNGNNVPINSKSLLDICCPTTLNIKLNIAANSSVTIGDIELELFKTRESLVDKLDHEKDVLVIVPDYPSFVNLYACAFAHSRNREYVKSGLNVQVFVVNPTIWFETEYIKDNVSVMRGTYKDLKIILQRHQYKTIVTHFVDEYLYPIFDGNVYNNENLIFICHGPETIHRYLVNKCRNYFTAPYKEPVQNEKFDKRDMYIKRYSNKNNVQWVFVSEWLKEYSEKELNIKFKNSCVIGNLIDDKLFPYKKKNKDSRKKILIIRRFDNVCQYSIDQVVFAIRELSKRPFFEDLEFSVYGDGNYYDELVEPIKNFKNVHLYRRFIANESINEIHKEHGIMLIPSRHDTQGVSLFEAASSGLVVVSSKVTCLPALLDEDKNNTLAEPENFIELANIIERLYRNPDEFLEISNNMSKLAKKFNKENTVDKEIELIKKTLKIKKGQEKFLTLKKPIQNPILTIGIPAYNVESYLEKCLISILNAKNSYKIEVLVINDGSTDKTAEIASLYEKKSNGIIKLINKENGGHGSTINVAIKEAKGRYFRLIDSDDWVDSENLSKLIDIMEKSDVDIILTKGCYDFVEEAQLADIIKYDNLNEGSIYNFEDLIYANYGFKTYGPLLTTGNYKTNVLKNTNFKISEKKPYVDMEFNAFSIRDMKTLTYYDLDIYRYLIGREGQTVSREYWKKKYKDHEYIIFNILDKIYKDDKYSENKIEYILKNIISQMVDSQIFMFDALCKWKELESFLEKLKKYSNAYEYSICYIKKSNGNCWLILNEYKKKMKNNSNSPIIVPGVIERLDDLNKKNKIKKIIKAFTPYGIIYFRRKYLNKKNN